MVCTRSQRVPLAEMTVEHTYKRRRTREQRDTRTTTRTLPQTLAQSPNHQNTNDTEFDESRENFPPQDHMLHICSPRTPKSGIYHTEWISSPFWRQSLSYDRVNRWESSADEIILKIFSYLKFEDLFRCALVCRHWRSLTYDVLLWSQFNLSQRSIPYNRLLTILNYGTRYLSLSCSDVKDTPLPTPKRRREGQVSLALLYADFGLCNISSDPLSRLLDCSRNLVKLNLESLTLSCEVLRAVSRCKVLQILNMAMCQRVHAGQLVAVTRGCTNLQELNLAWCGLSEGTFLKLFPRRRVAMLKLNISGGRDKVTCETIRHLTTNLPNLISLDISDCHGINKYALHHISRNCPALEELTYSRVFELYFRDVLSWLKKMKKLTKLNSFYSHVRSSEVENFKQGLRVLFPHVTFNAKDKSDIARPCTELKIPKGSALLWEVYMRC